MFSTTERILIVVLIIVGSLAITGYALVVWVVRIAINHILREMNFVKSSVTVTEQYVYNSRREVADLARDMNTFFRLYGVLRPIEAEKAREDELRARAPPGGREPDL